MTGLFKGAGPARGRAMTGACALLLSTAAIPAGATSLRILPVRIDMAAEKQFCSLSIANDDAGTATVQIRGFGWRKDAAGNDRLDPSTGPMVNPSIVTIPGRETRLIRCSLPAKAGPGEESYRLVIDELPTSTVAPGTVRTLLRISLPLFRAPSSASPWLNWSLGGDVDQPMLLLANQGDRHVQAIAVKLRFADGRRQALTLDRSFYLLAGDRIPLPVGRLEGSNIAAVEVETSQGKLIASHASGER